MSRKDEAIVRDLLPDGEAIEAYFEAKGKAMPPWAKTAIRNYWRSLLPDERIPILALRAVRAHLGKPETPQDLLDLFARLVALCELFETHPTNQRGHKVLTGRSGEAFQAIFNQMGQLERKYNLEININLSGEIDDLEEWEKQPPSSYPQG